MKLVVKRGDKDRECHFGIKNNIVPSWHIFGFLVASRDFDLDVAFTELSCYIIIQRYRKGLVYMPLRSTEHTLRRCMRKLVRQKKLDNITINDICEMARIGKRTFYRYYADKYALFEDTYIQEFFSKLDIPDDLELYSIYERIVSQMSEEREFFLHAITAKGQNGFWEVISNLMFPYTWRLLDGDPYIDRAKEYYIRRDIDTFLYHIEKWLLNGCKIPVGELIQYIRFCHALHGKWEYQIAMKKEIDEYSLEKFINNEW